jgi:segregation and condensation protein A
VNLDDYRVQLDAFHGPLDLLLFLIRREEIDIYDIPIARITEQYCQTVLALQAIDPNAVGDFLVLAATLMEVKSRLLLPKPPPEEGEEPEDPRMELVRQLLEYKQCKDASSVLSESAQERALRFARPRSRPDEAGDVDIEDVPIWELLEAFRKLMEATGRSLAMHEVVYDDTPIGLHVADLLDRLEREQSIVFVDVFAGRSRSECIGLFLALLELIRQRRVRVEQPSPLGEVYVHLLPPPEESEVDDEHDEPAIAEIAETTPVPADSDDERVEFEQDEDEPATEQETSPAPADMPDEEPLVADNAPEEREP